MRNTEKSTFEVRQGRGIEASHLRKLVARAGTRWYFIAILLHGMPRERGECSKSKKTLFSLFAGRPDAILRFGACVADASPAMGPAVPVCCAAVVSAVNLIVQRDQHLSGLRAWASACKTLASKHREQPSFQPKKKHHARPPPVSDKRHASSAVAGRPHAINARRRAAADDLAVAATESTPVARVVAERDKYARKRMKRTGPRAPPSACAHQGDAAGPRLRCVDVARRRPAISRHDHGAPPLEAPQHLCHELQRRHGEAGHAVADDDVTGIVAREAAIKFLEAAT